jgi:hypothetical protein
MLSLTDHHATKGYWGSGGIAPLILDPGTRWRWVVSFTPRPFHPKGRSPWNTLDRRLGELQSRSGRGGEEKNSQPLPGIEPQIMQPVAQRYTTELTQLPFQTWYVFDILFPWQYQHWIMEKRAITLKVTKTNWAGVAQSVQWLGYMLYDWGSIPCKDRNFSLRHLVQTGSEAHSASYPMGIRGSFLGVKRPGREADQSPPSSVEVQ